MLQTGLGPTEAKEKPYIASMGIYVFKKDVLSKLLGERYPQVRLGNSCSTCFQCWLRSTPSMIRSIPFFEGS